MRREPVARLDGRMSLALAAYLGLLSLSFLRALVDLRLPLPVVPAIVGRDVREHPAMRGRLTPAHRVALPAHGVYAACATVTAGRFPAAVSVGVPPSFPDATCELEAHLLGFSGDLYGQEVAIEFVERIRDQRPFPNRETLSAAIADDVARIAALLANEPDAGGR